MDGYVRVSRKMGREGPGYISPTVQRRAIEQWAERHGVQLAAVHVDEDETGGSHDRPGLNAAMQRVRDGATGGIVAWKIDRFSRMTEHGLRDLRELQDHGARLAFVDGDVDAHGPVGFLLYTVMLGMAEFFLSQMKAGWRVSKGSAMDRGAVIGPTPFGYVRGPAGVLLVDPVTGDIVREAFDVAARAGLRATVRFLDERCKALPSRGERGIREGGVSRTWTTSTVRRMLGQRCYLGEFTYGDLRHNDPDLALTSRETWQAAQPGEPQRRRRAADYPLSGIAHCGTCGTHMVGARGGRAADGSGLRTYRCAASLTAWRGDRCAAPATMTADRLEPFVREQLAIATEKVIDGGLAGKPVDEDLERAFTRLQHAEQELDAFMADLTARRLLGDRYHEFLTIRTDELREARAAYDELLRRHGMEITTDLPEFIRAASLDELEVFLRRMVSSVVVQRGRGPVDGRVRLVGHEDPVQ